MNLPRAENISSIFILVLSLAGLVLIILLTPSTESINLIRIPTLLNFWVGITFDIFCVLGILASVFPTKCSGKFHSGETDSAEVSHNDSYSKSMVFSGHHPECRGFSSHVFRIGNKVYCAGCIGLMFGAILSIVGVSLYFFSDLSIEACQWQIFWIGSAGVFSGLLQYHLFNLGRSSIHLFVNVFFVSGVSMLLVAVDSITKSSVMGFYVIGFSLLWLYTRILLSQRDHEKTCTTCSSSQCQANQ